MGAWIAAGIALVGAGATVYGANQASDASNAATQANQANTAASNQLAWSNYLMSRGISPNGAATGTVPTNATAINAKLPLWANVTSTTPSAAQAGGKPSFQRVGATPAASTTTAATTKAPTPTLSMNGVSIPVSTGFRA